MNPNLLFDFTVNKETNTIYVKREFAATPGLVWKAWTTAELLDQWWAPLPYQNKTKTLDFRAGGRWHYSMISPENQVHWCCFDYEKIETEKSYSGLDAFCDEAGTLNPDFARMHWHTAFSTSSHGTVVTITITVDTLETLEKIIEMGFKEGFTMGLNQLENLLTTLKK
ncbi:MAG: SRPBCC domain-containing protein [Cytophagales bacterium]|nr:SRPBCC domain-containing protein [Cytophagales bacterium]